MRDTHYYIGACLVITLIATGLTYIGKLDANNFVNLIEWTFSALVAGGSVKKIGETITTMKGGGNAN